MKPSFALNLSHEGIILLHRSPRGNWIEVGDVSLENAAFAENLSFLRATAVGLEGKGFGTKLIIPDSQILYREIHAPGPTDQERREQVLSALQGQVPYEGADLSLDWIATGNGQMVLAAVVANETLDEAEEFAVEHRFNPVSFVGPKGAEPDAWEPFFGKTDFSISLLGPDADVRDTPPPGPPEPDPDDLFAPGIGPAEGNETARVAGDMPSTDPRGPAAEEETNFFAPESPATSPGNIFTETETDAPPQFEGTPAETTPDVARSGDQTPPKATPFASRRPHEAGALPDDGPHIVSRITPRIVIQPDDPAANHEEATETTLTADSRLRAVVLEEDDPKTTGAGFAARILGPVAGRLGVGARVLWGRAQSTLAHANARGKENADGQKRQVALAIIGALAVVTVIGLGVLLLLMSPDTIPEGGDQNPVLVTTAAERGVRADNRARGRPSDFATIVASVQPKSVPSPDIPLVRPERRSKFEGATDPDADLPDTAQPVTDLTEKELAAIKAAGLMSPTSDEIAEGVEAELLAEPDNSEADALYSESGILQSVRTLPPPLADQDRDDIFVASIDRALDANDAIILPDFNNGPADDQPRERLSPLAPGTVFDLDESGLVVATAEGALNPQGILVRLGKPGVTPPEKPLTDILVPPNPLLALTPKARPADLKTGEDAVFVQGRLTLAQLRGKRAKVRPLSEQAELTPKDDASPSELAVLTSYQPAKRPSDFSKTVEKTRSLLAVATPATQPAPSTGPVLPTRANVAKQATIRNAINLSKLNLIGVSGPSNGRKALLRLPSGRFVRVEIGDRIDGGRVAAIGVDSLSYVKSGRNRILKIPQ